MMSFCVMPYQFTQSDNIHLSRCTNSEWLGCERNGTPTHIINPIRSARLRTVDSFSFRYGRLEIVAKLPTGDWMWPGIKGTKRSNYEYVLSIVN